MAHVETAHHAEEEYTTTGLNHRKLLMWTFLGSDCMFFGALIATYMVYRGQSLNGPYPIDIISVPVTTISTFVLLCSSFAMVQALAATNRDDQRGIKIWLLATAFLDEKAERVVLVIINNAQEQRALGIRLSGVQVAGHVTGEQSYGDRRWQPLRPFLVESPERIRTVVPALSVTTLAAPR